MRKTVVLFYVLLIYINPLLLFFKLYNVFIKLKKNNENVFYFLDSIQYGFSMSKRKLVNNGDRIFDNVDYTQLTETDHGYIDSQVFNNIKNKHLNNYFLNFSLWVHQEKYHGKQLV